MEIVKRFIVLFGIAFHKKQAWSRPINTMMLSAAVDVKGQLFFSAYGQDQENVGPTFGSLLLYMQAQDPSLHMIKIQEVDMDHPGIEMLHFAPLEVHFDQEMKQALRSVSFSYAARGPMTKPQVLVILTGELSYQDGRKRGFRETISLALDAVSTN